MYHFSIENQSSNKTSFLPTQGETGMAVLSTKTKVLGKKLQHKTYFIRILIFNAYKMLLK